MIVVGVDPGGRDTGIAVVDTATRDLLASTTVHRADTGPLTYVPPAYLRDVLAAIVDAVAEAGGDPFSSRLSELGPGRRRANAIAVERVEAPGGFAGGKRHTIDPKGLLATSVVFGAVLGRQWSVPIVAVRARGNGRNLPLNAYPGPLATNGKGHDRRRHERSAYDVALLGPNALRLSENGYSP